MVQNVVIADEKGSHLPPGYSKFTFHELQIIRFYLIESTATYQNKQRERDFTLNIEKLYL